MTGEVRQLEFIPEAHLPAGEMLERNRAYRRRQNRLGRILKALRANRKLTEGQQDFLKNLGIKTGDALIVGKEQS